MDRGDADKEIPWGVEGPQEARNHVPGLASDVYEELVAFLHAVSPGSTINRPVLRRCLPEAVERADLQYGCGKV